MDAKRLSGVARIPIDEDDPLPPDCDRRLAGLNGLEDLYRRERPGLLRLLSRRVPPDCAEDIVQHAFVRMAQRDDRVHGIIFAPAAYLREAARNLVRDRSRSISRTGEHQHLSLDDEPVSAGDPVAMFEARDKLVRLEQAVLRLKPLTREIFLACRLDGYSYAEIAEQTGLSVKGVEKQMSRALKQLGRQLRSDV